jgi:Flp pilus assembly protein TadG
LTSLSFAGTDDEPDQVGPLVADNPVKMQAGIRRKRVGGSARRQALLAEATSSADVRREARGRLRQEDGQALVEFAIALPVLLLLVTGIIQFGLLYNRYITLTDAVRSGAQTLAIGRGLSDPCDPAVSQTVNSASAIGLTSGEVTPTFSTSSDSCGTGTYTYNSSGNSNGTEVQGDQATVTATQPFTLNIFSLGLLSVNLTASASDSIE